MTPYPALPTKRVPCGGPVTVMVLPVPGGLLFASGGIVDSSRTLAFVPCTEEAARDYYDECLRF